MGQFQFEAAIRNATALGYCGALKEWLVEIDFDQLTTELEDGEFVRVETSGTRGLDSDV